MKRINAKGRSINYERYVRHEHWQLNSAAWHELSPTARCLEIEFKMLYNGGNNGSIFLSERDAAKRVGVSGNTIRKAFADLQDKGFIRIHEKGGFTRKNRVATTWILTEFPYAEKPPTKDFMHWVPQKNIRTQIIPPMEANFDATTASKIDFLPSKSSNFDTVRPRIIPRMGAITEAHIIYHEGCVKAKTLIMHSGKGLA